VGGKVGKGVHGKRSRESGYTVMEEHHYRTHIFLSPTGGGCQGCMESEPMTQRRPSVTLMKWAVGGGGGGGGANRRKQSGRTDNTSLTVPETPTGSRQVSFSNGPRQGAVTTSTVHREPVTLATLNKDCFIIPVASLDRFLPAGVPVSSLHGRCASWHVFACLCNTFTRKGTTAELVHTATTNKCGGWNLASSMDQIRHTKPNIFQCYCIAFLLLF
jgi:hypothetical protein